MSADGDHRAWTWTIRQLCQEFGCTARALRFYEDRGLLHPTRRGLSRIYSYRDRARLQLVMKGKRLGLSLAEIGELIDLYDVDDAGERQALRSLATFKARLRALESQRTEIETAMGALHRAIGVVEQQLADRAGTAPARAALETSES